MFEIKSVQNEFGFKCDVCQTVFIKKKALLVHKKQEHSFCLFKCPTFECSKEFTTIQLLNRHIKRIHDVKER